MQNYSISYILENSIDQLEIRHLVLSNEIFTCVNSLFDSYITLSNHNPMNYNRGVTFCIEVLNELFDNHFVLKTDFNTAYKTLKVSDPEKDIYMIREIVITFKLLSESFDDHLDEIHTYFEPLIKKVNTDLMDKNSGFRLFSRRDAIRPTGPTKINNDTIVYSIYNTSR